jgi:hypothetical protein
MKNVAGRLQSQHPRLPTGGNIQVFNGRGIGLLHTFGTTRMLSNSRTANTNAGNGSGIANFK